MYALSRQMKSKVKFFLKGLNKTLWRAAQKHTLTSKKPAMRREIYFT